MTLRTPLSRVLGLGAAKEGVDHWWTQRLTSVALVPLSIWFFWSLLALGSLDYDTVHAWLGRPLPAAGAMLLVLVLAWHSNLGVQVVIEDYVQHPGLKLASLVLAKFFHVALAAAGVFALLGIATGGVA